MAFRFCDSFDHYSVPLQKWTAFFNSGISFGPGRNDVGMYFNRSGINLMPAVSKTLDYQGSWVVGWAMLNDASPGLPNGNLFQIFDNFQLLLTLSQENDGTLTLHGGNDFSVQHATNLSHTPLQEGVWYYIELKMRLGGGVDTTLRINGQTMGNWTIPTYGYDPNQSFFPGQANRFQWSGSGPTFTVIDDLYIADMSGSGTINDFIGDVAIGCIYPRQDVLDGFSPNGNNYQKVKEHPPDGDTTFVNSNNIGAIDSYLFDTIQSFAGTIPAVHLNVFARKADEGYRAFAPVGLANVITRYVNDDYTYYSFPDDSGWSPATVNATAFGYKIVNVT